TYISARGERICCVYDNGELFVETIGGDQFVTLFSGTSFATPQVAGAVAILAQAFPNLTANEIVEILLDTARDAGAAGDDAVFGTGILDIAAAIAPQGTTTVAGTANALALADDFAIGSAAMGDALQGAQLSTTVLDRYDRAYNVELGNNARNAAQVQRLRGAVERDGINRSVSQDGFAAAVTIGEGQRAGGLNWTANLQLSPEEADGARLLAARVAARVAPDLQLGFAISQGAKGLVGQLQGADRPAFAIAPKAGSDAGFLDNSELAFAARHTAGPWGLTVSAERGRAWLGDNRRAGDIIFGLRERRPTTSVSLAADRRIGAVDTVVSAMWLSEQDTFLGAHFNSAVGLQGADSLFLDVQASHSFAGNWRFGGAFRGGVTRPRAGALIGAGSQLLSEAWSLDLARFSTFTSGDWIGVRVSQPLRVSGGALEFDLPVAFDYASETPILGRQRLSLSPEGREIMGEIAWGSPLLFGYANASVFYRNQPGHFANAPADMGMLIGFDASF
ncbi:MAG: S8 family serine peptidase, partial [Pseudomonadota bacterium]